MNRAFIIFSGFNMRAVVAFLRTLKAQQVNFVIIAASKEDPIFHTDYKQYVGATRSEVALRLDDLLKGIKLAQSKIKADRYSIAPSTEALNRFLLDHQSDFEALQCEIPLVNKQLYETISNKQSFAEVCAEHNIAVPAKYPTVEACEYPFVAKPKRYYDKQGQTPPPMLIFNEAEKQAFMTMHDVEDFFYQAFIAGSSYYLLYYFYRHGEVAKFSQINYVQQPEGKSIIAAESANLHESNESRKYEDLLIALDYRGLIMIEVRRQEEQHYMIEANPRFWGPSQLFVDAGLNLFEAFLYDWEFITQKPRLKAGQPTKYFWFGGAGKDPKNYHKLTYLTYSQRQFIDDLPDWLSADVYNRSDTQEMFKLELAE